MTVSTEAKRTLVKSPPELWSEVSDAESLARHLDGVQQIRITHVEAETAVEWEAAGASGSVRLQPSGFGTKVTLSLSRELPPSEPVAAEHEPATDPASNTEPETPANEPAITQTQTEPPVAAPDDVEPESQPIAAESDAITLEPEPVECEPAPQTSLPDPVAEAPREGFFARLFKRRRKPASPDGSTEVPSEPQPTALAEPEPTALAEPEPTALAEPEPIALAEPEPMHVAEPEPRASRPEPVGVIAEVEQAVPLESQPPPEPDQSMARSVAADLTMLEAEIAEHDEAMLTAMLDRLGAAHHRPFSRS